MEVFLIGIGGGLGACSRYVFSKIISKKHNLSIPLETLIINVLGSFALGLCTSIIQPNWQVLLIQTGFMGGFTTFSTFMLESFNLYREKKVISSFFYVFSSIILGVSSFFLGLYIV